MLLTYWRGRSTKADMMRIRTAVLLGLALVGITAAATSGAGRASAAGPQQPAKLRVATYNIHAGAGEDDVFDLNRTAAALQQTGAGVIGLQEVDVHWADRSDFVDEAQLLAGRLDMHVYFAPIYDEPPLTAGAPDRKFGTAILSRYPIVSAVDHDITRLSTQDPNPTPEPAPGFPEVRILVHGTVVRIFDTHLDYRSDPSVRRLQVADMLRIIGSHPRHTILLGDFNAAPDAAELAPLWTDLVDVLAKTPNSGQLTYPAITPTARDDYVAGTHDIGITDAYVPDIEIGGTQASDHRPVVADLEINRW